MAKQGLQYPLEQVLDIKKKRVDEAQKLLEEKREALRLEEEKLVKAKEARQKVQNHHDAKLQQIRDTLDSDELQPEKVLQMKAYLKIVKENLLEEDKKVEAQKEQVKKAEEAVKEAKDVLKKREVEVDKIESHRKEWMLEARKELERKEAAELDEIGSVMFMKLMKDRKKS